MRKNGTGKVIQYDGAIRVNCNRSCNSFLFSPMTGPEYCTSTVPIQARDDQRHRAPPGLAINFPLRCPLYRPHVQLELGSPVVTVESPSPSYLHTVVDLNDLNRVDFVDELHELSTGIFPSLLEFELSPDPGITGTQPKPEFQLGNSPFILRTDALPP
jgi:hypothetical protein